MRPLIKRLHRFAPLFIGVILVAGTLIFFNLNRATIHNELVTLYLIPQPERLTELYFNNNAKLPSSVTNNKIISFAFVIHNLETADYQYVYDVSIKVNGTKRIVDSGNIVVKNDQYYVKQEKFKLTNLDRNQEVVVELLNKQQSIDFWMGK